MIVPVNFHRQSYRPDRFRGTTTQEVNFDELSYIHLFLNKLILVTCRKLFGVSGKSQVN